MALKIVPSNEGPAAPAGAVALKLHARPIGGTVGAKPVLCLDGGALATTAEFVAEPGMVYAVVGHGPLQSARTWGVFARHAG